MMVLFPMGGSQASKVWKHCFQSLEARFLMGGSRACNCNWHQKKDLLPVIDGQEIHNDNMYSY